LNSFCQKKPKNIDSSHNRPNRYFCQKQQHQEEQEEESIGISENENQHHKKKSARKSNE
jgi:hypothetical protein